MPGMPRPGFSDFSSSRAQTIDLGNSFESFLSSVLSSGLGALWGRFASLNLYGLKQFRDAEKPRLACYQQNTRVRLELMATEELRPDRAYSVRLSDLGVLPFASNLGLAAGRA